MRQLQLKPAAPKDAPVLARIHVQARAAAMPWLPVLHTEGETRAWMTDVVLKTQEIWIVVGDGTALGFMALTQGWIEQLYIDPVSWRTGAGAALLQQAKQRQPNGFLLWTFQRNAIARAFYRKHGLVEIRKTDGYDNEEKEPDVLLGWKLTS